MAFVAKKFLIVLEINSTLFYLRGNKDEIPPHHINIPVKFTDNFKNIQISYRGGRAEFLNNLFINLKNDVDVAVWSSLNNQFTDQLTHRYFTRYYRDLLFVMATNRGLYGNSPLHSPIRIRRDFSGVYSRFPGYNETNTMMVSSQSNLLQIHSRNDLLIPKYDPQNPDFKVDPGILPLAKYLQGLIMVKKQSGIADIRRFINAKQVSNIFQRTIHNNTTQWNYL